MNFNVFTSKLFRNWSECPIDLDKAKTGKIYFDALTNEIIAQNRTNYSISAQKIAQVFLEKLQLVDTIKSCSQNYIYFRIAHIYSTLHTQSIQTLKMMLKQIISQQIANLETATHKQCSLSFFQVQSSIQHFPQPQNYTKLQNKQNQEKQNRYYNECEWETVSFIQDISSIHEEQKYKYFQNQNCVVQMNWVDQYLETIVNYRSQINLFCQLMKINFVNYQRQKQNNIYYVTAHLNIWYFNRYFEFVSDGRSTLYKHACEQAAFLLLRKVYSQLPQLWSQFVRVKQMRYL